MKTVKRFALPAIFLLHLIPVLHQIAVLITALASTSAHLTFERYPLPYAVVLFLLTLFGAIFRRQIMPEKGFGKICAPFLLPVALLNTFISCFHNNMVSTILSALSCICALIICLVAPNKKWKRILSYVFSFMLALLVTVALPLAIFFRNFGIDTVVQTTTSPDGAYIAELSEHDAGALGGVTQIEIMKRPISLIFGRYTSRYYLKTDDWAESGVLAEMRFEWADNKTLIYENSEISMAK